MKKNLYSTTFAFLIFPLYSTLLTSFFIPEKIPTEVNSSNAIILELTQSNQDFSFPIEKKGINTIQLCNLEDDKNYQLYLSEIGNTDEEQIYFLENPNEITRYLQIKISDNCYEILIQNSYDLKEDVTLSVQSFPKKKELNENIVFRK